MQEMDRRGLEKPPRVKRTVLKGRRTGAITSTPVRRNNAGEVIAMAKSAGINLDPVEPPTPSSQKLAASLWELQGQIPISACFPEYLGNPSPNLIPYHSSPPETSPFNNNSSPWSQPEYVFSPTSFKSANHRKLKPARPKSLQRLLTTGLDTSGDVTADASIDVVHRKKHVPSSLFATTGTDEVESGRNVTTSQELPKLFSQIRLLEERHSQALNFTTALHKQLMQVHARVRELELPDNMARQEVKNLMKTHKEEKVSWRVKEKKIKAAVQSVKEELEEERKEKSRLEDANCRLTKELREAQAATAKALQELETERKTRQLIDEVFNELAQETENDKAEVEEMKRQSQQVRDALEEERQMLQLAEVWREARVQMKLGEARHALETKSAALDVMWGKLESFLASQQNEDPHDNVTFRDAQVLHDVVSAVRYDTSSSTFPPTSSLSSICSNSSYVPTSEYMYGATLDTDSSQESRDHEELHYPEGIPDAD